MRHPLLHRTLPVLLVGLSALLPMACSDAKAGTPGCCQESAALIARMDECCVQNLGKPVTAMTGCCVEGMRPEAESRPECCAAALALHARIPDCCRKGMKSSSDVCCDQDGVPSR